MRRDGRNRHESPSLFRVDLPSYALTWAAIDMANSGRPTSTASPVTWIGLATSPVAGLAENSMVSIRPAISNQYVHMFECEYVITRSPKPAADVSARWIRLRAALTTIESATQGMT